VTTPPLWSLTRPRGGQLLRRHGPGRPGVDRAYGGGVELGRTVGAQQAVRALSDGRPVLTSNSHSVSVSTDYGATWRLNPTTAWSNGLWSSVYQTGPDELAIVNSMERTDNTADHPSYDVRLRFGRASGM
jgi:hypothetical protein